MRKTDKEEMGKSEEGEREPERERERVNTGNR